MFRQMWVHVSKCVMLVYKRSTREAQDPTLCLFMFRQMWVHVSKCVMLVYKRSTRSYTVPLYVQADVGLRAQMCHTCEQEKHKIQTGMLR